MLKKTFRAALSLVLVFCLLLGMSANGLVVLAAQETEEDKTINYVSIGDSMANGYGFTGYYQNSNDINVYDFIAGTGMYGKGAYPLQFEAYLKSKGYDVNHTKLATSAMLAEDLLFLLGGREEFDDGWSGWRDYVGDTYTDEVIKNHIQTAVTNADIITMGIGNAAFGAFMLDRVTSSLGVFGASLDDDEKLAMEHAIAGLDDAEKAVWMEIDALIDNAATEFISEEMAAQYNVYEALNIVKYTVVNYLVNYTDLIEKMLEMNPDMDVILVGLLNTTYGMNITDDEGNVILAFGDMMDSLFNLLNAYMAGLPAMLQTEGEFYFAEQPEPKFICQEFEKLLDNDWVAEDPRLDGATIRDRNIDAFNDSLGDMIGKAVTGAPLAEITLADVQAYEALDFAALKAQVEDKGMGAYWSPWAAFYFNEYITDQQEAIDKIMAVSIYLAIEEAVARSTNTMDIPMEGLMTIAGDLSSVFTELGTPPEDAPESTRTWLLDGLSTEKVLPMCKIYGLFKVGNGMSVHPTPAGHDDIAKSVINAYESGHTVDKETDENLADLEHAPVAKAIYKYLRSNNYIDEGAALVLAWNAYKMAEAGAEMGEIATYAYETLLYAEGLNDAERIEIIGSIGGILQDHNYIDTAEENKYFELVGNIYNALTEKGYLIPEQVMAIVNVVFYSVMECNGDMSALDVKYLIGFIYDTLFNWNPNPVMFALDIDWGEELGDINNEALTDLQKLDLILTVYNELKESNVAEEYPEVEVVGGLLEELVVPQEGEAILSPEQVVAIVQTAMENLVTNSEEITTEAAITNITNKVTETVQELPIEKQLAVIEKVTEAVEKLPEDSIIPGGSGSILPGIGGGEDENGVSMSDITYYLSVAQKVITNLKEHEPSLWTGDADEKYAAISGTLFDMLLNKGGELDPMTLVTDLFDMLFGQEGHTLEQKIQIVVVIYDTLAEEGLVVSRGDAYDYVMDLVDQIDNILNSNLSGVITDLRGDLNILRGELNEQVNALNLQLQKLTDEEREVLEELLNEREALVEELNALKAQLEAISNGQLTRRSAVASTGELVEELNAAIAETEAKIAALDASIAALNAKIAADLQGVAAIQNAIAEVEQQLNDTLAALAKIAPVVNQLNADLEVLYEASKVLADAISNVTNLTFGKIDVEAVIEAVTTIYEMVPAVIEQMEELYNETKAAYEYAKAAAASLKPAIDEIRATIETIVNGAEELAGIEGEKLAAIQAAVAECEKAVNGFIADNYDSVEKALTDTYNELMNLAYGEIVKAENLLKENETMILAAAAGAVLALDQAGIIDIENATWGPVAQPYVEMLNGKLEELRGRLDVAKQWLKDNYPIAREELDKKIQALRDRLEELELEIPGEYDPEKLEALLAECEELNKLIDAATEMKNKLDAYAQQVLDYIAAVEAAMEEVRTAMDAVIAAGTVVGTDVEALWNELVALGNELEALAETVDTLGREAINELMVIFGYCEVVADDFVALLKTLPAYVEVVEKAVEMATDIEFWLDLAEELKPTVEELAKKLLDLMIQYGKEYAPVIDEALYDYFYNNPEQVIAFFAEYGDEMLALAEEYGDEALGILGVVLYLYGEDMVKYLLENPEDAFANFVAWAEKYGDRVVQMIQVYAEATGLCDIVRGEIGKLEQELEELENELGIQLDLLNDVLLAQLAELRAQLENALEEQRPAIEAAIEELLKQIEDVKTLIAEIQAAIDQIKAMLPELQEKLQALVEALENLDEAMKDLIGDGIETGAALVQKALDEVATAVKELIGVASEELAAQLGELIEQAKEMLDKAYYDATHSEIHIDNDFHYVGIGDDSAVSESYVDLLAKELGISYENLAAAGLSMTDLLYILDENFVADEYTNATFEGDVEALREAYIAALLKADMVTIGVGSFGITDLMYAQAQGALATMLREQLGEWLDWEFGGERPVYDMMSQYVDLSATTYTMDWATYLGEEGVAKLAELLADVRADLIEKGIPETYTYDVGLIVNGVLDTPIDIFGAGEIVVTIPVADLLTMMVESYMYAYVTHLFNAGEVFNLIHEINPEAELLVVGMFNPMDEIVLNLAGTTIALGDYYDYLVDVMNLRYLGYAFVAPNTTFVAIPDAQSTIDIAVEQFENIDEMLMALALGEIESNVDMTEAGQIYVKDQILNALVITKGILGDANEDGRVSSVDAMLALQYAAKQDVDVNEVLADVNGDGRISAVDAMLILQYAAKAIDEFPAEQ